MSPHYLKILTEWTINPDKLLATTLRNAYELLDQANFMASKQHYSNLEIELSKLRLQILGHAMSVEKGLVKKT